MELSIQQQSIDNLLDKGPKSIYFPEGLKGFESVKNFIIKANEGEIPLLWLESFDSPEIVFLVIDPYLIFKNYQPEISIDDKKKIHMRGEDRGLLLCIVRMREIVKKGLFVNLSAPLLINLEEGLASQVILINKNNYSLEYQLSFEQIKTPTKVQ